MPENMLERMLEDILEDILDRISDRMLEYMLENMPNRMPEDLPKDMWNRMPDRMPGLCTPGGGVYRFLFLRQVIPYPLGNVCYGLLPTGECHYWEVFFLLKRFFLLSARSAQCPAGALSHLSISLGLLECEKIYEIY